MKTGIELIAQERQEQIEKHGRTVEKDVRYNHSYQLSIAASKLLAYPAESLNHFQPPNGWDIDLYKKMREHLDYEHFELTNYLSSGKWGDDWLNDNQDGWHVTHWMYIPNFGQLPKEEEQGTKESN